MTGNWKNEYGGLDPKTGERTGYKMTPKQAKRRRKKLRRHKANEGLIPFNKRRNRDVVKAARARRRARRYA